MSTQTMIDRVKGVFVNSDGRFNRKQQHIVEELVEVMRGMFETLEAKQSYGLEKLRKEIMAELHLIKESSSADKVVHKIEEKTAKENKEKEYDEVKEFLNTVFMSCLSTGAPLFKKNDGFKNPILTKEGRTLHDSWSKALVQLGKVSGCKREKYTNRKQYNRFFRELGVQSYGKMAVNYNETKGVQTVFAAIIVNGHAEEYTKFLLKLVEEERNRIVGGGIE